MRGLGVAGAAVLVVFAACGCQAFSPYRYGEHGGSRHAGALVSRGGELGDFTFTPDRCTRAALEAVDFSSTDGTTVMRFGLESTTTAGGPATSDFVLRIARRDAPGGAREVVLRGSQCVVWYGYAHWIQRDGAVRFECTSPEAGHLSGYAAFIGCS
jgi:hypothetical protein